MTQTCFASGGSDFNNDGVTDFADFLTLSANFGKSGMTFAQGDSNGDGDVGFADFLVLSGNFSATNVTHGEWNAATGELVVNMTAAHNSIRVYDDGGVVKLQENSSDPVGVLGSSGLCIDLDPSLVVRLTVNGSSAADTIECDDVKAATWSSLRFCEINGEGGADDITGSEIDDRIFGGAANDTVDGDGGTNYLVDYNQQGDSDTVSNCNGLSLVWKWAAGDITETDYDSKIATGAFADHPVSPTTDHVATATSSNSSFILNAPTSLPNTSLLIGNSMVVPRMLSSEKLEAHLRYYTTDHDQCQFRPRVAPPAPLISPLDCQYLMFANKRYRWVVTCEPSADTDWDNIAWNVITQLHPGPVGGSVNLYIRADNASNPGVAEWGLLVRGNTTGATSHYEPAFSRRIPFTAGDVVTIDLEFTLDYRGETGNAYTRVDINDVLLGETKKSNGLNHTGGTCVLGSEQLNTGVYSTGALPTDISKRPIVTYHSAYLYAE